VEEQLRRLLGTRVSISTGRDRGKIEIAFYNEDDLNRILGLLGAI
jgi:ParB family chromosome partitioning protein